MNHRTPPAVSSSPWDAVQECTKLDDGVFWVSTAGHGGLMIDKPTASALLSEPARRHGMDWGNFICYEEDCQCSIVFFDRPAILEAWFMKRCERPATPDDHDKNTDSVKNWEWRYYEERTGITLQPGESYIKDEMLFYQAHAEDWLGVSATGGSSWEPVPEGFVKVTAAKGGRGSNLDRNPFIEPREFLVPRSEYSGDGPTRCYPWKFAFIVDPTRHPEVTKAA